MAVPANVIYFTGYDWLRFSGASPLANRVPDSYAPLVAGSVARTFAAISISPIEMFRTRLQAASLEPSSKTRSTRAAYLDTFSGLRELTRLQGYTSLWRGLSLTLWRDVPFSGLYWWGYETIHAALKDARRRASNPAAPLDGRAAVSQEHHTATLVDSFTAGAISGALAAVVTTPFDVGKTRQQVLPQSGDAGLLAGADKAARSAPEPQSMPRFLWQIGRTEGLAGLWKGWAARCLKVAPACAIMISSYEIGKKMARGMNEKDV
jgi:solute carrier family 25 protein 39/40